MPNVTKGLDILVYIGADSNKKAIGGQKGCTLTMEADTMDISNKNDERTIYVWAKA